MALRPGNAGSNTASEHVSVLNEALWQVPTRFRRKILVRLDGAGASHEFIEHLAQLSSTRRKVYFTSGFPITEADENAIGQLPAEAWGPAFDQDGEPDEHAEVAELTGISPRTGWGQVRFIVRRVKPSRRHAKKPTEYEKNVGWRFQLIVTNIPARGIRAVPGSHHAFFLDALQRQHAVVEDRVRTEKATGIRNLPFTSYARNQAWLLAANIASDLLAYLQLLGLDQDEELAAAEPDTLRAMILHIPARLTSHARRRVLKIERSWPWADAVVACWERLGAIPAPN
jgi:Transposase DDE domain group 1